MEELLVDFHRGPAVEDGKVINGEGEAITGAVAGEISKEDVRVTVSRARNKFRQREVGVFVGMEVERNAEAESGVPGHGGKGEVGGPTIVGGDAPRDGEVYPMDAKEGEGAKASFDCLVVIHDVRIGDDV